jgi:hypothetical protein
MEARGQARKALNPVEFRFSDPADVEKYGDRWFRYSELEIMRLPARELIELEGMLGMPIPDMMNGMRMSSILGDTAGAWLGVRAVDEKLAGDFDSFNPITMLIEWRPAVDEGKDQAPTESATAPDAPATPPVEGIGFLEASPSKAETSETPPTVTLSTLPITA